MSRISLLLKLSETPGLPLSVRLQKIIAAVEKVFCRFESSKTNSLTF